MPLGYKQPIDKSGFGRRSYRVVAWLIVGSLFGPSAVLSGPTGPAETAPNGQAALPAPSVSNQCVPRVSSFGYYPTQWRSWAGERRPDRFFPQSIGLEAIPTPEPGPMPELPRQKISPEKPSLPPLPKLPTELPLTPPEEKPLATPGGSQVPALPPEKPFRIEERSPLEGIQPSPLEPMRPGGEKPGVQMPLPLEPSGKPASQIPLPLESSPKSLQTPLPVEPMPKPATQMPLPLEPLPGEKPSGSSGVPGGSGPTGKQPALPSPPEQPESRPALPPLPSSKEKPSSVPPAEEPVPEKPSPAEKSSRSVPLGPPPVLAPAVSPIEPIPPNSSPPASAAGGNSFSSSVPPTPPIGSESAAPFPAESRPSWPSPTGEAHGPIGSSSSSSRESIASRAGTLADPLEPWAEPRAWQPTEASARFPRQVFESSSGGHVLEARSAQPVRKAPLATLPPEAPPIEPTPTSGTPHPSGPAQAAFQADLPAADRLASGLAPGASAPVAPDGNYKPDGHYELDGYCPVSLLEKEQWVLGTPQFAVQHQGKVYLLAGPAQRERFLANPGRYAPAGGGFDPVLALEEHRLVPGRTDFCVVYDGRLYLFSSSESLARFHQNPKKYASFARSGL